MESVKIYIIILWLKIRKWEYWPRYITYFLSGMYYIGLIIKTRSFFFISASNPSIVNGGVFGESKYDLYNIIPREFQPITLFIPENTKFEIIKSWMQLENIRFPIIVKPDKGGMGWEVEKIENDDRLKKYLEKHPIDLILQEFINYPNEYGIFYVKLPNKKIGFISSITQKLSLCVYGNGIDTLKQLIISHPRAIINYFYFKKKFQSEWLTILPKDKEFTLNSIGNHARGAIFKNLISLNSIGLSKSINKIVESMPNIYFGRFDIMCQNIDHLKNLKNFKILEFNGAGSVPTHIFEPSFPFIKGQIDLIKHIYYAYKIAQNNHKKGGKYISIKDFYYLMKTDYNYRKKVRL